MPPNCNFQIISFGGEFEWLNDVSVVLKYNEKNQKLAMDYIDKIHEKNMGGTEILEPLQSAFKLKTKNKNEKKRYFLLTDGAVVNEEEVIKLIDKNCGGKNDDDRLFTFGVGYGASKSLVMDSAKKGRGQYFFVDEND